MSKLDFCKLFTLATAGSMNLEACGEVKEKPDPKNKKKNKKRAKERQRKRRQKSKRS